LGWVRFGVSGDWTLDPGMPLVSILEGSEGGAGVGWWGSCGRSLKAAGGASKAVLAKVKIICRMGAFWVAWFFDGA
jgi:hypothetical protein